jgi:hypothetical protein
LARAGASPTRSGPEGSSRNEPHLGRCQPLTPLFILRRHRVALGRSSRHRAAPGMQFAMPCPYWRALWRDSASAKMQLQCRKQPLREIQISSGFSANPNSTGWPGAEKQALGHIRSPCRPDVGLRPAATSIYHPQDFRRDVIQTDFAFSSNLDRPGAGCPTLPAGVATAA